MIQSLKNKMIEHYWNIGFMEIHEDDPIKVEEGSIRWLKHNCGKFGWFADPFILEYNDKEITVLVEEYDYDSRIGYISKLVVDKAAYTLLERIPLLKLDTHLSFPNILRDKDHLYIYPENGRAGVLNLYELDNDNNKVHFIRTLVKERLSDASIYQDNRGYFLLSTVQPDDNKDELVIYHSKTLFDEFVEFKRIKFPDFSSRNAGGIYKINDKIYKISQDCNGGYGKGLVLYEMSKEFEFRFLDKFYLSKKPIDGLHTYNRYKELAVVDFHAPRYPLLNNTVLALSRLKHCI